MIFQSTTDVSEKINSVISSSSGQLEIQIATRSNKGKEAKRGPERISLQKFGQNMLCKLKMMLSPYCGEKFQPQMFISQESCNQPFSKDHFQKWSFHLCLECQDIYPYFVVEAAGKGFHKWRKSEWYSLVQGHNLASSLPQWIHIMSCLFAIW